MAKLLGRVRANVGVIPFQSEKKPSCLIIFTQTSTMFEYSGFPSIIFIDMILRKERKDCECVCARAHVCHA